VGPKGESGFWSAQKSQVKNVVPRRCEKNARENAEFGSMETRSPWGAVFRPQSRKGLSLKGPRFIRTHRSRNDSREVVPGGKNYANVEKAAGKEKNHVEGPPCRESGRRSGEELALRKADRGAEAPPWLHQKRRSKRDLILPGDLFFEKIGAGQGKKGRMVGEGKIMS